MSEGEMAAFRVDDCEYGSREASRQLEPSSGDARQEQQLEWRSATASSAALEYG